MNWELTLRQAQSKELKIMNEELIAKLASGMKRMDEIANIELADEIVENKDSVSVKQLIDLISHPKKEVYHDVIKVLYEIGERNPELISPYVSDFIALLNHKSNRMQWGAMTALQSITLLRSKEIYAHLNLILDHADSGSVITRDNCVKILVKLASFKSYTINCSALLLEQLLACPDNQFPMYAELSFSIIHEKDKKAYSTLLNTRMQNLPKDSQKKRIEKLLKKLLLESNYH